MSHSPSLLVADHRGGTVSAIDGTTPRVVALANLAEHAGFLALPGASIDRWAFADDAGGALVVGGTDGVRRIPIAIPAEHIACDARGGHVVVTSGLGMNEEAWSDVVSVVDLAADRSVRFRSRIGEPGVVVADDRATGEPVIVLRHREPGQIEAIPLAVALETGPHVPVLRGLASDDVAADGHGDVVHQGSGIIGVATGRGLERFVIDRGAPRAIGIVRWPGDGRAYYLRLDPSSGHATGIVRGGPPAPGAWTEWTNTFVDIDLETGETSAVALPPGLAFRFALARGTAAVAVIHPDGDTVASIDLAAGRVVRSIPIPAMTHPPRAGHLPWDAVDGVSAQRRSIAIDSSDGTIAVTSGGDATVLLLRDDRIETLQMPTALDEGGCLYWGAPLDAAEAMHHDTVGR